MMKACLSTLVCVFLIVGCQQETPHKKLTVISKGSDYAEVKASLVERGMKEETDLWDIAYPETQKAYTYFLDKDTALLIFVDRASGTVVSLSKYEKVDQPKSARNWTGLDSFDMDKELSNN